MKKSVPFCAILLFIISLNSYSQEEPLFGIRFSGFIKNDFILDSRQTVSVREGHFLLYPENVLPDRDGEDINARANFDYLSIQSRLHGAISGPDAFGAKTSGVIEGEFFGTTNTDINGFRLRHAFFKLKWENTELLMGQYWHMMFVTDCYAGTVSFNTGAPFQFFSRNPQIRLTRKLGNLSVAGMAATQRDFSSPGGPDVLRNALLPDLQGQITLNEKNIMAGITAGYKRVVPRIQTDSAYKTSTALGGFTGQAFLKISTAKVILNFQATYLQNGYDGVTLGGFAIRTITDPLKDFREYSSIDALNFWTDISTTGTKVQAGLFAGYARNLGSRVALDDITTLSMYTRGWNIASLYRISPRIIVNSGKTRFALEIEHTGAAYGKTVDNMAIPGDVSWVANNRILVAAYYFF